MSAHTKTPQLWMCQMSTDGLYSHTCAKCQHIQRLLCYACAKCQQTQKLLSYTYVKYQLYPVIHVPNVSRHRTSQLHIRQMSANGFLTYTFAKCQQIDSSLICMPNFLTVERVIALKNLSKLDKFNTAQPLSLNFSVPKSG